MQKALVTLLTVLSVLLSPLTAWAEPEGSTPFRYVENRGAPAKWIISWEEPDGRQVFVTDGIALRRTGGEVLFDEAEIVLAAFIRLDDGREANNCYSSAAPMPGVAFGGVVNPWDTERRPEHSDCDFAFPGAPPATVVVTPGPVATCKGQLHWDQLVAELTAAMYPGPWDVGPALAAFNRAACPPPEPPRRPSGIGQTIRFSTGERVFGFTIRLDDGRSFSGCVLERAPMNGSVLDGVVWPWLSEIAGKPPANCKL